MKLDDNNYRIDKSNVNVKGFKRKILSFGTVTVTAFLISIFSNQQELQEMQEPVKIQHVDHDDNETVEITGIYSSKFDDDRKIMDEIYSYDDLKHLTELHIGIVDYKDYDFLNYMPNLEKLTIENSSTYNVLDIVDGSNFTKPISISLSENDIYGTFNQEKYGFLESVPYIENLYISAINVDSTFLQSLKNVHNLDFNIAYNTNFHYEDLTYLDGLNLRGKPYDISIYFSNEILGILKENNVNVTYDNYEKVKEVNNKIDDIIADLNISNSSTDIEKLNAIISYILENYEYDSDIAELIRENKMENSYNTPFYANGMLTAIFEKNTQICGNYAAITTALSNRVGLDVYNTMSSNHGWNIVKIGDYYYYLDTAWMDQIDSALISNTTYKNFNKETTYTLCSPEEIIESGNQEMINELRWYLEDPTKINDESHNPIFIPEGITIEEIPDSIEVGINNKNYLVKSEVLVGILMGLGLAGIIGKKKSEKTK